MYTTMDIMCSTRKIFSHGDEQQRPTEECYVMLLFINSPFRLLP
jgi:hypothetical protein